MESLQAHLLISAASLHDPNFRHTVVLIGTHDEEGAAGVILNRPTGSTVAEAVPPLTGLVSPGAPLFEGGPVRPEHPVVVAQLAPGTTPDLPILDNIGFMTGEVDDALRPSVLRARVFAGYSGWGAGQLEAELAEDAWIVEPATAEDVFGDDPEQLWKRVLERKGGEFRWISRVPKDPRTN